MKKKINYIIKILYYLAQAEYAKTQTGNTRDDSTNPLPPPPPPPTGGNG